MYKISDQATLRAIALAYNDADKSQNWAPVYQLILKSMQQSRFVGQREIRERHPDVDPAVYLWVEGALKVNTNEGLFATYIRNYTIRQHQLRSGETEDLAPLIQENSNQIAQRFAATVLGHDFQWSETDGTKIEPAPPKFDVDFLTSGAGVIPDLYTVGRVDASAAAYTMFNKRA